MRSRFPDGSAPVIPGAEPQPFPVFTTQPVPNIDRDLFVSPDPFDKLAAAIISDDEGAGLSAIMDIARKVTVDLSRIADALEAIAKKPAPGVTPPLPPKSDW